MKLRSLIFSSFVAVALSAGMVACSDDDEDPEVLPDPMETVVEYYVHGSVSSASGAVSGASVKLADQSATSDNAGNFNFTVKEKKTYNLSIEAKDFEKFATDVTIAANAENRSDVKVNVKLAKAIVYDESKKETVKKDEPTSVEAAPVEEAKPEEKVETSVEVPANAVEENTTISAATYEEPKAETSNETTAGSKKEEASVANVAIKTEPADAKAKSDIAVAVANEGTKDCMFDPASMTFYKTATKAGDASDMIYDAVKNCYYGVIKAGSQIAGKYSVRINNNVTVGNEVKGATCSVNGTKGTVQIDNNELEAKKGVKLNVVGEIGWDYVTEPAAALKAIGANEEMAKLIRNVVNRAEGAKGYTSTSREIKTDISGHYRLLYTAWEKNRTVTYTFKVLVKGQLKNVDVKVLRKTGIVDQYTNQPLSQHSGGTGK